MLTTELSFTYFFVMLLFMFEYWSLLYMVFCFLWDSSLQSLSLHGSSSILYRTNWNSAPSECLNTVGDGVASTTATTANLPAQDTQNVNDKNVGVLNYRQALDSLSPTSVQLPQPLMNKVEADHTGMSPMARFYAETCQAKGQLPSRYFVEQPSSSDQATQGSKYSGS